jgi:hypothetical protein
MCLIDNYCRKHEYLPLNNSLFYDAKFEDFAAVKIKLEFNRLFGLLGLLLTQ